jgi:hypothetical protein
MNSVQRPTLRSHPQLRNALDLVTGKPVLALNALLRTLPTHLIQAGTPLGLSVFRAFPSETTARNSSLRALLHAFHSLTLLWKQASSSELEPRLRGCEPSLESVSIPRAVTRSERPMLS